MDWNGRPVVVTGAGGFIGSHIVERLAGLGAQVTGVVRGEPQTHAGYLSGKQLPGLNIIGGDLRDCDFIHGAIAGADTVFHLGAVTSVQYSFKHPSETIEVNTMGTNNVCLAAKAAGARRMLHASTGGSYGNAHNGKPITEEHTMVASSPYVAGKIAADYTVQTHHLSYGLPVATVRLFNAYGPRVGRFLIIPSVIQQFLKGPHIKLGDLTPTRPFLYIDDIVDAFLAMAEADAVDGDVIHFGGPESISMAEVVDRIAKIIGVTPEIEQDPSRMRPKNSEIHRQSVDGSKAERMLAWKAKVGLTEGLQKTIDWVRAGGYEKLL